MCTGRGDWGEQGQQRGQQRVRQRGWGGSAEVNYWYHWLSSLYRRGPLGVQDGQLQPSQAVEYDLVQFHAPDEPGWLGIISASFWQDSEPGPQVTTHSASLGYLQTCRNSASIWWLNILVARVFKRMFAIQFHLSLCLKKKKRIIVMESPCSWFQWFWQLWNLRPLFLRHGCFIYKYRLRRIIQRNLELMNNMVNTWIFLPFVLKKKKPKSLKQSTDHVLNLPNSPWRKDGKFVNLVYWNHTQTGPGAPGPAPHSSCHAGIRTAVILPEVPLAGLGRTLVGRAESEFLLFQAISLLCTSSSFQLSQQVVFARPALKTFF